MLISGTVPIRRKSCFYSEGHASYRATRNMKTKTFTRKITKLARIHGGLADKGYSNRTDGLSVGTPSFALKGQVGTYRAGAKAIQDGHNCIGC